MEKYIFIDVDGTLGNYENKIPEGVPEIINKSRKKGNKVLFCTGRSKAEVYPELWDIGFDGMIGGNGNYIEMDGKEIFHKTLPIEIVEEIINWLYNNNLEFYLESNAGLFASKNFEERAEPAIIEYSRNKGAGFKTVREAFPEMIFNADLIRDDINKISFVLNSYQDFLNAQKNFPDLKVGTWGGVEEKALFGDIALNGITKGSAIRYLQEMVGFNKDDAYAFGDATVDIPMFKEVGTGIAMGNSSEEVKKAADYTSNDVDENGLVNAFKKFNL